ncbi:hypothetical protein G7Y89_g34 [Cudoniella acicularis]|uniref:Uncharacterized protein n=1 Tax=Cudoniella acicularis TaxID=354080 RepID=A0A8H4RY00_9HELO|nr:hypothetical protein G7Y89_g34 [Cudoniella acicularis]
MEVEIAGKVVDTAASEGVVEMAALEVLDTEGTAKFRLAKEAAAVESDWVEDSSVNSRLVDEPAESKSD